MKWSWLRAAILGALIGPAPVIPEPIGAEPDGAESRFGRPEPAVKSALRGRAIRGPDFLVWDEDSGEATDWALDLLSAHGDTPGVAQMRSLATRSAARPSMLTPDFESALQEWILTPGEPVQGGTPGLLLCLVPALDRTCLISSWATSPDERVRIALAGALSAPFDAVGVREALERLREDPSHKVRELARVAEATRR